MEVPFVDLKAQYKEIREEIEPAFRGVLEKGNFASGPLVAKFEEEFAAFCQCQYAVGVSCGTSALWFALLGLGIGAGDEVITVPNSFAATAEAIRACGATPVFVDITPDTHNMSPEFVESAITSRTKAIVPVHLFGQVADLDPIMDVAKANGLFVVEDACQAHGAEYKGRPAGSIGDAGCWSFYPSKNLGACGEAGAVVTNDEHLAKRIRALRDHGQVSKYYHSSFGWNGRMDELQAAVLSVKLKHLPAWNEARRKNALLYEQRLSRLEGVMIPKEAPYAKHVYHIYALRIGDRDALKSALEERGIHCGIHYPVPLHLQRAFQYLGIKNGRFPAAESDAQRLLSIPMFPELTPGQIDYVSGEIERFVGWQPFKSRKLSNRPRGNR